MATLLQLDNFPQTNIKEATQLAADYAVGTSAIAVQSANGFSINDICIMGVPGSESVERLVVQSVSAQTITFTTPTLFKHAQYDPLVAVKGDQLRIYTAANVDNTLPADSNFILLTSIAIDLDEPQTEYNDPAGSAAVWYKYTFYAGAATYESLLADSIATRGGGYGHYCSIDDIRQSSGFVRNQNITNATLDVHRNRAESEINAELYHIYTLPFPLPAPWLINHIATKLASGYAMIDEFGTFGSGTTKDGTEKIKEAQMMLQALKSREQVLTDALGKSLVISQSVSSNPNDASDPNVYPRAFTRGQIW